MIKKGTRIYYGGDRANAEGVGTIETVTSEPRFGTFYDIALDDGRNMHRVPVSVFSDKYLGHGGTRFVTLEAYNSFRREQWDNSVFKQKCGEYRDRV